MPLTIIADTPQEVLGKVADWLVEYADTVSSHQEMAKDRMREAVRAETMQLIALVLRAGTVMPAAAFNAAKHPFLEPPRPAARWNRRLPVKPRP
jgi:hypothetical protein